MKLNSWSVSHRPNSVNETPNGKVKVKEYLATNLTLSYVIPTQEGPECRKIRGNSLCVSDACNLNNKTIHFLTEKFPPASG